MRVKVLRNRLTSIVVSLALSFCLWLALAGQDTSTVDLTVPLELSNLPSDLAIRSEIPASVSVQVLANTAQVRFLADRKLHLWLNVASAREGLNSFQFDQEALDLPRGVQVRRIIPPGLDFTAVKLTDRVVSLTPTVRGTPDPSYRVRSLSIEPDVVTLKGPHEVLDAIESLTTLPIDLDGLTRDAVFTVTPDLSAYAEAGIVASPPEIKATVRVEERSNTVTFQDLPIELDLRHDFGTGALLTVEPPTATVSVSWPASRPTPPQPGDVKIRAFVDADKLKRSRVMQPHLVVVPSAGLTVTAINPVSVTVTYVPPAGEQPPEVSRTAPEGETPPSSEGQ